MPTKAAMPSELNGTNNLSTEPTFPYYFDGPVVKGFGRGSKQLGCPTANLESNIVEHVALPNGIYLGFAQLEFTSSSDNEHPAKVSPVYMMCCSLGYNPHYGNEKKSLEVHILNNFEDDFYGDTLRVAICGFIRSERKFDSLEDLKTAIRQDIGHTRKVLEEDKQFSDIAGGTFFLTPTS
jgi:riboflavin kinase